MRSGPRINDPSRVWDVGLWPGCHRLSRQVSPSSAASTDVRPPIDRKHLLVRIIVAVAMMLVFAAEIRWLVPHFLAITRSLDHPRWEWTVLAVAAEVVSMTTFARLQRNMLSVGGVSVPLRRAVALAFAANAMSVTLPAGSVMSTTYTYKHLRLWGASGSLVTFTLAASGILSFITLGVVGVFGAELADSRPNLVVLALEFILVLGVLDGLRRAVRRPNVMTKITSSGLHVINWLLRRPRDDGQDPLRRFFEELGAIRPGRRDWGRGLWFVCLNWAGDFVCLIAACRAVGAVDVTIGVALVAYAAGMAASSIPLVPGGLGVVDGALILGLTRGGVGAGRATAGVIAYRLVSLALMALIGFVAWTAIRHSDRHRRAGPDQSSSGSH